MSSVVAGTDRALYRTCVRIMAPMSHRRAIVIGGDGRDAGIHGQGRRRRRRGRGGAGGRRGRVRALAERYRPQLLLHCYRMVGSLEDAEDLVQETFLRAWRSGRPSRGAPRSGPGSTGSPPTPPSTPWRPSGAGPGRARRRGAAALGGRRGCSPTRTGCWRRSRRARTSRSRPWSPRRRSSWPSWSPSSTCPRPSGRALIVRDVLGWSARETAALLETSVPAVNSALQRARATMQRAAAPAAGRAVPGAEPSEAERALLQRYVEAHRARRPGGARGDPGRGRPLHDAAAARRLAGARTRHRRVDPRRLRQRGLRPTLPADAGDMQPAVANYLRRPGAPDHRPLAARRAVVRGRPDPRHRHLPAAVFRRSGCPRPCRRAGLPGRPSKNAGSVPESTAREIDREQPDQSARVRRGVGGADHRPARSAPRRRRRRSPSAPRRAAARAASACRSWAPRSSSASWSATSSARAATARRP